MIIHDNGGNQTCPVWFLQSSSWIINPLDRQGAAREANLCWDLTLTLGDISLGYVETSDFIINQVSPSTCIWFVASMFQTCFCYFTPFVGFGSKYIKVCCNMLFLGTVGSITNRSSRDLQGWHTLKELCSQPTSKGPGVDYLSTPALKQAWSIVVWSRKTVLSSFGHCTCQMVYHMTSNYFKYQMFAQKRKTIGTSNNNCWLTVQYQTRLAYSLRLLQTRWFGFCVCSLSRLASMFVMGCKQQPDRKTIHKLANICKPFDSAKELCWRFDWWKKAMEYEGPISNRDCSSQKSQSAMQDPQQYPKICGIWM